MPSISSLVSDSSISISLLLATFSSVLDSVSVFSSSFAPAHADKISTVNIVIIPITIFLLCIYTIPHNKIKLAYILTSKFADYMQTLQNVNYEYFQNKSSFLFQVDYKRL